jgi:hypothetical protein
MNYFESKNLIDYFCVCGLDVKSGLESEPSELYNAECTTVSKPPLDRSYKCKILNHFPSNLPWNPFDEDAVTQLCLPKGLVFQKHHSKPVFHPFVITREDGSRVYGATLKFFELVEDESICNAMQSLQTMYDAEYTNSSNSSKVFSSATVFSSALNANKLHHRSSSVSVTDMQRNHLLNLSTESNHHKRSSNNAGSTYSSSNTTPITTKSGHSNRFDSNSPLLLRNLNDLSIQQQDENENINNASLSESMVNNSSSSSKIVISNKVFNNSRLNNIINITNQNGGANLVNNCNGNTNESFGSNSSSVLGRKF